MERKRFINYTEENNIIDSKKDFTDNDKNEVPGPSKEIKDGKIVTQSDNLQNPKIQMEEDVEEEFVMATKKKNKPNAVKSAPPKKKTEAKDDKK